MLTWLIERSPLARIHDREAELLQLGTVRLLVGAVCIARLVPNLWVSLYLFPPEATGALPALAMKGVWVLGLTACVTAGILTPIALPALVVFMRNYELETDAASLVTELACLVLTFLFFAGAGSTRSVDAWLMRRQGFLSDIVRLIYRVVGAPSLAGLRKVYLLFFLAYAFTHLGGAMYHWQTEAWTSGDALAMVFSSSYLARFWESYRALESVLPDAAHLSAAGATFVQLLMQTMTVPMMFWRRTAPVAVLWGFLFTTASMVMLQLNYLGLFELLLWFTLFRRPRSRVAPPLVAAHRPAWVEHVLHAFGAAALTLFVVNDVVYASGHEAWWNPRISRVFSAVGLQAPDVFNNNDLRLGDVWPVVYYGDHEHRLPFHGLSGERLSWIWWSDLLFYSIANRWKNDFNEHQLFDLSRRENHRLTRLALFDHRRRRASEGRYVVDYYRTRASYVNEPPRGRFEPVYLGSQTIVCAGVASQASCAAVATRDARATRVDPVPTLARGSASDTRWQVSATCSRHGRHATLWRQRHIRSTGVRSKPCLPILIAGLLSDTIAKGQTRRLDLPRIVSGANGACRILIAGLLSDTILKRQTQLDLPRIVSGANRACTSLVPVCGAT